MPEFSFLFVLLVIRCGICHAHRSLVDGFFQLYVRHFLNGLGILQLLDKFHFQHLHLHDFSFLLSNKLFLLSNLSRDIFPSSHLFLDSELFYFGSLQSLLLLLHLCLQLIFLVKLTLELHESAFGLLANEFGLLGFFLFVKYYCVFDFAFFFVSFVSKLCYFVSVFGLTKLIYFGLFCLLPLPFFVLVFEFHNLLSSPSGFVDFLPSSNFLLLQ